MKIDRPLLIAGDKVVEFFWTWFGVSRSSQINYFTAILLSLKFAAMVVYPVINASAENGLLVSSIAGLGAAFVFALAAAVQIGYRMWQCSIERRFSAHDLNGNRIAMRDSNLSSVFRIIHMIILAAIIHFTFGRAIIADIAAMDFDATTISSAISLVGISASWWFWNHDVILEPMGPRKKIKLPKISMPRISLHMPSPAYAGSRP